MKGVSQFFICFIEEKSYSGSFLCLGNMKEAKFVCFPTKRNYFTKTLFKGYFRYKSIFCHKVALDK